MSSSFIKEKLEEEINSLKNISLRRAVNTGSKEPPVHLALMSDACITMSPHGCFAEEGSRFTTGVSSAKRFLTSGNVQEMLFKLHPAERKRLIRHCEQPNCGVWVAQKEVELMRMSVSFYKRLLKG